MNALIAIVLLAPPVLTYEQSIVKDRAKREERLMATNGWLSVAGLFWLHEGKNTVGADPSKDIILPHSSTNDAGDFVLASGKVSLVPKAEWLVNDKPFPGGELKPDISGKPDLLKLGYLTLKVIVRGDKVGIRMYDEKAETRTSFKGIPFYPVNAAWKFRAKFVAYNPVKKLPITNVLGQVSMEDCPGFVEFSVGKKVVRLDALAEDGGLFINFRDSTSGKGTYPAGRFLYTGPVKDGFVEVDFNRAQNPPCAFTSFATCPLPPAKNHLKMAIPAGEKYSVTSVR